MLDALIDILVMIAKTANMIIIVWFVIGLLFAFNVVNQSNQFLAAVYDSIGRLFEPVLRPIRRMLPNTGAIDFSPMVFLMILWMVTRVLIGLKGYS